MTDRPPMLPWHLAELMLVTAIRSIVTINPATDAQPIHALMTVLPVDKSVSTTDVTRAALTQLWWIDLDYASKRGDLDLLETLLNLRLRGRPLTYTRQGLRNAVVGCHVDVLDWWYAKREQGYLWFADLEFKDGFEEALDSANAGVPRLFEWHCKQHDVLAQLAPKKQVAAEEQGDLQQPQVGEEGDQEGQLLPPLQFAVIRSHLASLHDEPLGQVVHGIMAAGKHGHAGIVQYLVENKVVLHGLNFEEWQDVQEVVWYLVANSKTGTPLIEKVLELLSPDPFEQEAFVTLVTKAVGASGSIELVQWLHSKVGPAAVNLSDFVFGATIGGHLHLVQWAIEGEHLVQLDPKTGMIPEGKRFAMGLNAVVHPFSHTAPEHDPTAIFKWWITNGPRFGIQVECSFNLNLIRRPLQRGHIGFVKWWLSQVEQDPTEFLRRNHFASHLVEIAAGHGNTKILELIYRIPAFRPLFNEEAARMAIRHGFSNVLDWWQGKPELPALVSCFRGEAFVSATGRGHAQVLTWWNEYFASLGQRLNLDGEEYDMLCSAVSRAGKLHVLDWLLQHYPQAVHKQDGLWQEMHPHVTRWWMQHGVSISQADDGWVTYAAHQGNTILLDLLWRWGYGPQDKLQWVNCAIQAACRGGHTHILDWLAYHGDLASVFTFGIPQVILAISEQGYTNVPHWPVIEWWSKQVKADDMRCIADLKELELAIVGTPEVFNFEVDEWGVPLDGQNFDPFPLAHLWPVLLSEYMS